MKRFEGSELKRGRDAGIATTPTNAHGTGEGRAALAVTDVARHDGVGTDGAAGANSAAFGGRWLKICQVLKRSASKCSRGPSAPLRYTGLIEEMNDSSLRSGRNPVGAGDGNRTRMASLEGWSSTIELHPRAPWSRISLEHVI